MERSVPRVGIGLLGPFGFGNLGDASIQQVMIQQIRKRYPSAAIYGLSLNPMDTQERHHIPAFPITRTPVPDRLYQNPRNRKNLFRRFAGWLQYHPNPSVRKLERLLVRVPYEAILFVRAYQALKNINILIVSGGSQLDDSWGGPWKHPYALFKWTYLAAMRHVKVMVVSVGAEQIDTWLGKWFLKQALATAEFRSYRDVSSQKQIEKLGLDLPGETFVYPDPAYDLPAPKSFEPAPLPGQNLTVGIAPIPYFDRRFWPRSDQRIYDDYLSKMAGFIAWLVRKQYRVVFLTGDIYPDRCVIQDLRDCLNSMGLRPANGQIVENPINSVEDLLAQIALTDLVVASRYHGIVQSFLMNKPVISISYQEKIDALMAEAGQAGYCLPIDRYQEMELIDRFQKLELNQEKIKAQLARQVSRKQAALDDQFVQLFKRF